MYPVPDEPMVPHKNHQIQSKILTIGELPHMKTALSFRQGQSYSDLSLLCKIRILEFLLDELVATVPITSELQNRHKVTSCYPGKFGPLPTVAQLEKLTNVDECVVCGIEVDLCR